MKIAKPSIMYSFIVICFVSCMAIKPHANNKPVEPQLINVTFIPVVPLDTLPDLAKLKPEQVKVRKEITEIIKKGSEKTTSKDSLNIALQKMVITLFARGVKRADRNDVLEKKLNALSDTLDARDKRDIHFRNNQAKVVQVEKVNKATFGMFNIIILVCLTICTIHALLQLIPWVLDKLFPNKATYE